jgi:hypothetical protein
MNSIRFKKIGNIEDQFLRRYWMDSTIIEVLAFNFTGNGDALAVNEHGETVVIYKNQIHHLYNNELYQIDRRKEKIQDFLEANV